MSTKKKASSKNKKASAKKVAVKKAPAKKKTAKPAAKSKPVKKSTKPKVAAKKSIVTKKATKPVKKPVAKKPAPKKVVKAVKKIVKKIVKAVKKVIAKKPIKKVVAKKAAPKKVVKAIAKPIKQAKPVVVAKKAVVAPVKEPKAPKPEKVAKVKAVKVPAPKKPIVAPTTFRKDASSAPTKFIKEPAGKFEMEFVIRASEDMVFEFISTESGLSEWFCDDVNIRNGVFTFNWDGQEQQAKLVKEIPPQLIRYQWVDKNDGSYFEFRTQKDELTNDVSLMITDFAADKADETSAKLLWQSQVDKLLHVLGSFF